MKRIILALFLLTTLRLMAQPPTPPLVVIPLVNPPSFWEANDSLAVSASQYNVMNPRGFGSRLSYLYITKDGGGFNATTNKYFVVVNLRTKTGRSIRQGSITLRAAIFNTLDGPNTVEDKINIRIMQVINNRKPRGEAVWNNTF